MRLETFGRLRARLVGGTDRDGGGDGPLVVMLHGFGAPGDDLVPLWRVLDVPQKVRFVFPEAPLALEGYAGGRAWWHIDPAMLERAIQSGQPGRATGEVPVGLAEARAELTAFLDDLQRRLDPPPGRIVLGGFSQGAMLSCDFALRDARPLAGLFLLSGTLVAEAEWTPLAPSRRGLPVLQSHGTDDPLLAFDAAERLRELLVGAGLAVEWLPFRGGHEIPDRVLERLGAFVTALA